MDNKIIVIGCPGSGKSTFSIKLAEKTGLPLYHLDNIYWKSSTEHLNRIELYFELIKIFAKSKWIIDGNYNHTLEMRIKRADLVYFLDLPTEVCLDGAKNRDGSRVGINVDLPVNDELLEFITDFPNKRRGKIIHLLNKYNKNVITFHSHKEIDDFFKNM